MAEETGKGKGFVSKSLGKLGLDTLFYSSDADELESYDYKPTEPTRKVTSAAPETQEYARVTPLRKSVPTHAPINSDFTEIETLRPSSFSEAPRIAELLRSGIPIVLDLSGIADAQGQRILDFASGVVLGVNGHLKRITGKVFIITPEAISISEGEAKEARVGYSDSGSFYVAPKE
ncbi:cell division protein SepF [Canibacter sp. lx-72]|uniref:cell division protein SepF n=1 Tax=Canibacter zhuwentaonis TaxID=2837491 RepID=UPI001BDC9EFE|nr:cell division protein SepF [Canibacter zhuwentaonis]MBT1018251.1 cell division protein SepF [Canibacter zhuwentaonis]